MVVFAGPHKSASSRVQELFVEYANNEEPKHPSFQNWTWPLIMSDMYVLPRKSFAPLVTGGIGYHPHIWVRLLQIWLEKSQTTGEWIHPNMIWGTEELDRFGKVPRSGRNGLVAMEKVWDLIRPTQLEVVVNYRRPRRDQWISIWKQLALVDGRNVAYSEFLCDDEQYTRLWEYLDCVANPLGFVEALVDFWTSRHNVTIHLLDMGGIAQAERDVAHVVACDVLGVECTENHWLPDLDEPLVENVRSGDPELTDEELDAMEWVLQQRDCSYHQQIMEFSKASTATPHLRLHYAEKFWDSCEAHHRNASIFTNTTFLLELLQSQAGCGPLSPIAIDDMRSQRTKTNTLNHATTDPSVQPDHQPGVFLNLENSLGLGKAETVVKTGDSPPFPPHDPKLYASSSHVLVLFLLTMVVVGYLFRRLQPPHPWTRRRWEVRVRGC